jgi:hypothetical protein
LSVAYVLGMALTYTIAGAAFAAAGQQAQAVFQKPWIIALFAALFVWLALGMFGLFNIQVPSWLQARVARISDKQQQGTLVGTAIMGALSSLIVTACVAPPLVASLAVIGQSGDVFRGGAALFALSLGMGSPLTTSAERTASPTWPTSWSGASTTRNSTRDAPSRSSSLSTAGWAVRRRGPSCSIPRRSSSRLSRSSVPPRCMRCSEAGGSSSRVPPREPGT